MNDSSSVPDSSHPTVESPAMNPLFGGDNGVNGLANNNSLSPTACRSMTHSSSIRQPQQQQLNNDSMNRMASSCQSSGCRSCDSSSGHNNRVMGQQQQHQSEAAALNHCGGGGHSSNSNNNSSHGLMLQLLLQNQQMLMQQQQLILFALMDQQRNNGSHSGHQFPGQGLASTGCRQSCCSGHNNWPQLTNASCLSASGSSCSSMTASTPVLALNNGSCAGHECVTGSGVTAQQVPPPIPLPYPSHSFAHSFPSLDPQIQGFGSPAAGFRQSAVRPEYQTPSHHNHQDQDSSPPQRLVHQSPHLLSIGSQNAAPVVVRNSAVKRRCIHASNSSLEHQQPLNNRMPNQMRAHHPLHDASDQDRSSFHANNNSQWHRQSSTAGGRVLNYSIPVQTPDSFSLASNSLTDRFRDSLTMSSSATSNPCVHHHQPMSSTPQSAAPATVHFHGGGNSGGGSQEDEAGSTSSSILTNFNNHFPTFFSSSSADPHAFPLLPPSVPRTQNNGSGQGVTSGASFTAQPAMGQPYSTSRGAGSSGGDRRPLFYRRQAMANGQPQPRTSQDHGAGRSSGGHVEPLGATGGHEAEQLLNLTTVIDKLLNENKSFMRHNNDKERNRMVLATATTAATGDKNSTTGGTSLKANNLRQTLNLGVGSGVTATTASGGTETSASSSSLLRNLLNNGNFVTNASQAVAAFSPDSNCSSSNSTTSAGHAVTAEGTTTGVRISVSTSSSMASSSVPSPSDSLREVGARLRREAEMAEQIEAALIANRDRVVVSCHNEVPHVAQEPLVSSSSQPEVSSSSGSNQVATAEAAAASGESSSPHSAIGGACAAVVVGPSDEENEDVDTGEEREEDEEPTTGESGYDQDVEDGIDGQADEEDEDDDDTIIRLCADAADELGQGL